MKKSLTVFLIVLLGITGVFAADGFRYGLESRAEYNVWTKYMEMSWVPYIGVGNFNLGLRAKWDIPISSTAAYASATSLRGYEKFDELLTFDRDNIFDLSYSIVKYLQRAEFDSPLLYVGARRGMKIEFDNLRTNGFRIGGAMPFRLKLNTPAVELELFASDLEFPYYVSDTSSQFYNKNFPVEISSGNNAEPRQSIQGLGLKLAPGRQFPLSIGLSVVHTMSTRYYISSKQLGWYHLFSPQADISANTTIGGQPVTFKFAVETDVPLKDYKAVADQGITDGDIYSTRKVFKNWAGEFSVSTSFGPVDFRIAAFMNQGAIIYRRNTKDQLYTDGAWYDNDQGKSLGGALDAKFNIGKGYISLSAVVPFDFSKNTIYRNSTTGISMDTYRLKFGFPISSFYIYGAAELEGVIGNVMDKLEFSKFFKKDYANIYAGVEIKTNILDLYVEGTLVESNSTPYNVKFVVGAVVKAENFFNK